MRHTVAAGFLHSARKRKQPSPVVAGLGCYFWQRPTLAGPVVRLPLALRRFTSVFGMGTGGSTALWSPEAARRPEKGGSWSSHTLLSGPGRPWGPVSGEMKRKFEKERQRILKSVHPDFGTAPGSKGGSLTTAYRDSSKKNGETRFSRRPADCFSAAPSAGKNKRAGN